MSSVGGHGDHHRERLFQELLDGTLSGERREAAILELRADPHRAAEIVRLRAALDAMRDDGHLAPDFSPAILDELGRRRGFLARSMRRVGTVARIAAVVGVVVGVGALATMRERSEGVLTPAPPAPMTQVVDAAERELGGCVRTLTIEARELGEGIGEVPEAARVLVARLGSTPKPLAIEPEPDSHILMLRWEIEPTRVLMTSGGVSYEPADLRAHLAGESEYAPNATGQTPGHAVWVVGSGSRWVRGARYAWPTVQPVRLERTSSFGLGKDAGYP